MFVSHSFVQSNFSGQIFRILIRLFQEGLGYNFPSQYVPRCQILQLVALSKTSFAEKPASLILPLGV